GCFLIFIMVVIGGITRLTHSGLSMVNWNLIMGTIPPLNEVQWQETFELYKTSPEYLKINSHFTLDEFKSIFFWEYLHRLIGRVLGLVFIIPFIYFLIKKKLTKKLKIQSTLLLLMGAMQGAIGWWMVKSGLVYRPDVSHYRLAIHLITAFLTCAYIVWVVLPLIFSNNNTDNSKLFRLNIGLFILIVIQIIYGAFVAGLNSGIGFNTWPKMGEKWIADVVFSLEPFWKNFSEGRFGIQFVHRTLALIIVAYVFFVWKISKNFTLTKIQKEALTLSFSIVLLQTVLGIFTLVLVVPFSLALIHQVTAFFLLLSVVYSLFVFKRA
ncbi:MAG TPA: COX15/CtaA family protein, partial [Flavobacteriales bacterium]|nr:COX15/CtaA family protein [Flavobacteriales bacterium]